MLAARCRASRRPRTCRCPPIPPRSDPTARRTTLLGAIADSLADWGGAVIDSVETIGDLSLFSLRVVYWLFGRLPRYETLLPNFYQVGVLSLPVIALTGTFIGMVLAVQSYFTFRDLGLETRLGAVINMTLVRELGPVLAATMLAGRVGCAMAAELGTMRVTEQIDALESMGADPIHYLVVPRFLACIFMIPTLTIMADFMGVVGGYFYSMSHPGHRRASLLEELARASCSRSTCSAASSRASSSARRSPWSAAIAAFTARRAPKASAGRPPRRSSGRSC